MSAKPEITRPLRIVLYSPAFHPLLGGLETVVQVLAAELSRLGQAVTVVTHTPNSETDTFPFAVLRQPSWLKLIRCVRHCDVFIHANVSLWGLIPLLFCGLRRPAWVATHHGWYQVLGRPLTPRDRLKRGIIRFATINISVSHAVDQFLGLNGVVIPNPYDSRRFRLMPEVSRDRDLVFLGRLVSDKGIDVLVEALGLLRHEGRVPSLTIIGSGPEREKLESLAQERGVAGQITFTGLQSGDELVRSLNAHRVMVVPSRWNEPFGVVALEGIACGCVVVGSSGGGLPEAIGPCGRTFANGDAPALAAVLADVLSDPARCEEMLAHAPAHLAVHEESVIAKAYLSTIRTALRHRTPFDAAS